MTYIMIIFKIAIQYNYNVYVVKKWKIKKKNIIIVTNCQNKEINFNSNVITERFPQG